MEKVEKELIKLKDEKSEYEKKLPDRKSALNILTQKIGHTEDKMSRLSDPNDERYVKLRVEINGFKSDQSSVKKKIEEKEKKLNEAKARLDNFDAQLSDTVKKYDSSHLGAITGTAGLMALANLGGFATYTFLTSMMSTLSFGILGFGAYTAATSFLSVVIGPVGWAGLGLWTIFTLGKPDKNKLVLLVATIGAIRQRVLYESDQV